jgi:hypothetical protein
VIKSIPPQINLKWGFPGFHCVGGTYEAVAYLGFNFEDILKDELTRFGNNCASNINLGYPGHRNRFL